MLDTEDATFVKRASGNKNSSETRRDYCVRARTINRAIGARPPRCFRSRNRTSPPIMVLRRGRNGIINNSVTILLSARVIDQGLASSSKRKEIQFVAAARALATLDRDNDATMKREKERGGQE